MNFQDLVAVKNYKLDRKKHGPQIEYNDNGKVVYSCWKSGILHGIRTVIYKGKTISRETYKDGELDGEHFTIKHNYTEYNMYRKGLLHGFSITYTNGDLLVIKKYINDEVKKRMVLKRFDGYLTIIKFDRKTNISRTIFYTNDLILFRRLETHKGYEIVTAFKGDSEFQYIKSKNRLILVSMKTKTHTYMGSGIVFDMSKVKDFNMCIIPKSMKSE